MTTNLWKEALAAWALLLLSGCGNGTPNNGPGLLGAAGAAGAGVAVAGAGGSAGAGGAGEELPADDVPVDFFRDIQPILTEHCVRCHGGVRVLGSGNRLLDLQSRETAEFALGMAGVPESSTLYVRVTLEDPQLRMPLGQAPLLPDQINKLRRWIYQGAPWPPHWAFVANANPSPDAVAVSDEAWIKTPVDRFILAKLDGAGLAPSPEASKEKLLRRVSLDLTGLPPTIAELDAFLGDASPTAYDTVVDRLLASPAFGERWGRHWLDQARYADSDGYQKDLPRDNAWRWRDWVINSFNQDQGFDQFTLEQIAGDLLPGATSDQILATGFHTNTLFNREGGIDPEEDRVKQVLDRTATVGQVWLGLTLGCTQCHSHPYDRIKQREFYNLYSFFNDANETTDANGAAVLTSAKRTTYLLNRGDFLNPDTSEELPGGTPAALHAFQPRGAAPDRLDLANWLISPDNVLTPRVFVNTVWYYLFGQGIVSSIEDFGARALPPSHPLLLDWLAQDFVSNGYKRKRLIRQIVLSATYRQAAVARADAAAIDPNNVLLHRQNRLRVDAEVVRDIFLATSGLLTTQVGGPSVYPPINQEILDVTYQGVAWPTSTGADRYRRGLYTFHKRTMLFPNLKIFDRPDAAATITKRSRSNTPLQALVLMHNENLVEAAQALARRVQEAEPASVENQIALAFRLAVARAPTASEAATLLTLFNNSQSVFASSPTQAQQAVGNYMPAGVDVATAAAWVNTARAILNLDEVVTRE